MNKKNIISICIGDIDGIGIDLLIRNWEKKINISYVLFTNKKFITEYLRKNKKKIAIKPINNKIKELDKLNFNQFIHIYEFPAKNHIENTYKSLYYSYLLTSKKYFSGIITLPLNKKKIATKIDTNFIGQTEYFQKLDKKKYSNMLLIKNKLIIATLTTHINIDKITKKLSTENYIYNKIKLISKTLIHDFKIKNPKLLISGINPHCGEGGVIGNQEEKILIPTLKKLKKEKISIYGPVSGDAMLTTVNIKKYDCFIFNFHDQALIPFKFISKYSGINFTAGLDVIRVSPDHGTAYELVGKNIATNKSLNNCFKLINSINKSR